MERQTEGGKYHLIISANGAITYQKLILDKSSVDGASLDIKTGTFYAGQAGSYRVMLSAEVITNGGDSHDININHNGEQVGEAKYVI